MSFDPKQDEESYAIIGAAMAVINELGSGFLEAVYQEALQREFDLRGIPYVREAVLRIMYRGELLNTAYKADFICFGTIIVELKALRQLTDNDTSQVLNYLRAANLKKALLLNFGTAKLAYRRLVF